MAAAGAAREGAAWPLPATAARGTAPWPAHEDEAGGLLLAVRRYSLACARHCPPQLRWEQQRWHHWECTGSDCSTEVDSKFDVEDEAEEPGSARYGGED
eukprot:CAMPEP_0179097836 /NCGR_PEP_ID=MMETSP0796-20121207/45051_1 /TAXON_ID=73915 /ORGANISM="Pyrodinium bahamense, Strain pbaha01" /LENGTH=98 /DNA_ID=CAMNT_0020795591 /DNA_START=50 /DNA_END=346 /DNA_ORIENTATION=+